MKFKKTGKKSKKIFQIILISSASLIVVTSLSIYLLLHSYINKMNLVNTDEADNKVTPTQAININADITDTADISQVPTDTEKTAVEITGQAAAETDSGEERPVMGNFQGVVGQTSKDGQEGSNEQNQPISPTQTLSVQSLEDDNPQEQAENVTLMEDEKVMNLLLIGIDAKSSDTKVSSESIALFTVNKKTKKMITTTLSNNIYLPIPGEDKNRLINAYRSGGADLLTDTIERNFKFKIDGYVMADYHTYIDIVDTIGGVMLDVSKEELEPVNINIGDINKQIGDKPEADIFPSEGTYLFNGKQALAYSRSWYTKDNIFIRLGKQKEVTLAIFDKVKNFGFIEMNGFLNSVLPHITTNLSESEIFEIILMLPAYFEYGVEQLNIPLEGTDKKMRKDGRTVLNIDMEKNIEAIYAKLYDIK